MSTLSAPAAASRQATAEPRPVPPTGRVPRPGLRVVPEPAGTGSTASVGRAPGGSTAVAVQPARAPFVLLVVGLLTSGLLGLLLLNTVLAQDAFVAADLERRAGLLTDQAQELSQQVAREEAPSQLAARAARLGMVPSENPVFLRTSDGAVIGVPQPGKRPPAPVVRANTSKSPLAGGGTPGAPGSPAGAAVGRPGTVTGGTGTSAGGGTTTGRGTTGAASPGR